MEYTDEYIRVLLLNLPFEIDGKTVICTDDTYIILINARLNHERQCQIYDREISYINNKQLHKMIPAAALEEYSELRTAI